jgi:hypothetical protein
MINNSCIGKFETFEVTKESIGEHFYDHDKDPERESQFHIHCPAANF